MCGFTSRLCRVLVSGYVTSPAALSRFSSISSGSTQKYPGGTETAIPIHPCEVGQLKVMSLLQAVNPRQRAGSHTPAEAVAGEGVGSPVTVMKSQPTSPRDQVWTCLWSRGPSKPGAAWPLMALRDLGLPCVQVGLGPGSEACFCLGLTGRWQKT